MTVCTDQPPHKICNHFLDLLPWAKHWFSLIGDDFEDTNYTEPSMLNALTFFASSLLYSFTLAFTDNIQYFYIY